jgi:ribosomal protein L11 methyltransferase
VARPAAGPRLAQWRRHTEPITVGDRLGVCFAWSEHERPAVDHLVELGAGGWGGHHPTTRLLLEELVARVGGGERVLDLGCGSGVLGLCALALGAGSVVALDVKEAALGATLANAAANGVADRVTVTTDPVGALAGTFDVVVANVGRAVLVDVGPDLASLVAAGGWLGASGFSPPQAGVVAARLAPLLESGRRTTADWCALVLRG